MAFRWFGRSRATPQVETNRAADVAAESVEAEQQPLDDPEVTHVATDEWAGSRIPDAVRGHWRATGFTPGEADVWFLRASRNPDVARCWSDAGFGPIDAGWWIAGGLTDPRQVGAWVAAGWNGRNASRWLACGFDRPADVASWSRLGFEPPEVMQWWKCGIANSSIAVDLSSRGSGYTDVAEFTSAGAYVPVTVRWLLARDDLPAELWDGRVGWALAEIDPSTALRWYPLGLELDKVVGLVRRRIAPARIEQWFISAPADRSVIVELLTEGAAPDEIDNLFAPPPPPSTQHSAESRALPEASTPEAPRVEAAPQLSRAPLPPVAPPSPPPTIRDFPSWLRRGTRWIDAVGIRHPDRDALLIEAYRRGLDWASPHLRVFDETVDDDWLTEVLARAESLRGVIRKVPQWPVTFESRRLTIVMAGDASWIRAWVGREGTGLLVRFRPDDFEVPTGRGNADARYAAGLAISWFLDCSVSLVGGRSHPHFAVGPAQFSLSPGSAQTGRTYVPRPRFHSDVAEVWTGTRVPPRAHRVSGHVRRLGGGRTPSAEARSNAPAYIRYLLGPDETFVREHQRGGAERTVELTRHLSKYSSLADALGLAGRR